jgi:hypothetical protein
MNGDFIVLFFMHPYKRGKSNNTSTPPAQCHAAAENQRWGAARRRQKRRSAQTRHYTMVAAQTQPPTAPLMLRASELALGLRQIAIV